MRANGSIKSNPWQLACLALAGIGSAYAGAAPPPPLGQVTVLKHLKGPPGAPPLSNMTFSVSANCTPAATTPTASVTAGPGVGSTSFTAPIGATCTIVENTPLPAFPAAATNFCAKSNMVPAWSPPTFNPGTGTVLVNSNQQIVQLRNSWSCKPAVKQTAAIHWLKSVSGPATPPGVPLSPSIGGAFVLKSTCGSSVTTTPMGTGSAWGGLMTIPSGTCTLTEVLPPIPATATAYCNSMGFPTASWNPPVYSVPQPMTIAPGATAIVVIKNSWKCG